MELRSCGVREFRMKNAEGSSAEVYPRQMWGINPRATKR